MDRKIEITNDVFDVARRIKEIDDGYFVLFDLATGRFEVHNRRQRPNTLCFVLPYDTLDCRAIDKVRETRVENVKKRLAELDEFNEKLARRQIARAAEECANKCGGSLRRLNT